MASEIIEGLRKALELILSGNPEVLGITLRSLYISGAATLLAASWSIPVGLLVSLKEFKGKRILKGVFNALLGVPTVGLGLILYLLLSKSGPLGVFRLLYTPGAIILGQAILITPIMASFSVSAIEGVGMEIRDLARTLGASESEVSFTVLREALQGVLLAVIASFNRAIAELGIALMLGGNIAGLTRVLTTSIALETARGNFELSIALTIVLLLIVFTLNFAVNLLKRE